MDTKIAFMIPFHIAVTITYLHGFINYKGGLEMWLVVKQPFADPKLCGTERAGCLVLKKNQKRMNSNKYNFIAIW